MTLTHGTLLGGRVRYAQPAEGYRTGIEPVLLAAAVPARSGDRVLEAGTGAGAGLLCLAARVPGVAGTGLERDPAQAALAAANFADNGFGGLAAVQGDVVDWQSDAPYDHAFANPPWHDEAGTRSENHGRATAKIAGADLLDTWAGAMARRLRPRGTLSLILPASHLSAGLAALRGAGCGQASLLPLWPRRQTPARLIILQGVRLGRGPCVVCPGLVLHGEDGGFSAEAEAVLRGGKGWGKSASPPSTPVDNGASFQL
jgi:tRNA1(Val) A37 N6-methylase TrmN6